MPWDTCEYIARPSEKKVHTERLTSPNQRSVYEIRGQTSLLSSNHTDRGFTSKLNVSRLTLPETFKHENHVQVRFRTLKHFLIKGGPV